MNEPEILTNEEIENRLKDMPGWTFAEDKISKTFEFKQFLHGIWLINQLAPFCDRIVHHPDMTINYKKIRFDLQRFDVGAKVTDRDFIVANEIERLYDIYSNAVKG